MATTSSDLAAYMKLPARLWRIEHTGAATAVGSSAWQTTASWVGQQKRFQKKTIEAVGGVPVTVAPSPEIAGPWPPHQPAKSTPPANAPLLRMARLLTAALVDLFSGIQESFPSAATPDPWPQHVWLALPMTLNAEHAHALWRHSLGLLLQQGGTAQAQALAATQLHVVCSGHTASHEALEQLNHITPAPRDALLIAVDSWMDIPRLQSAFGANHLLTDKNQDGFIASEAAAAVWLHAVTDTTAADERHWVLHPPALARSTQAHQNPVQEPDPQALAQVFSTALIHAGWKPEHVGTTLSDSDGSAWRAGTEMAAMMRTLQGQDPDEWHPAAALGQVGAATGALHWALAAQRLLHDKTAPNSVLSWTLDAHELAAAVAMERTVYNEQALKTLHARHQAQRRRHQPEPVKTYSARFLKDPTT